MLDFTALPLPGAPLEFVETYFYYDGPKAFALKATSLPLYYIVNTVAEDDDSTTNLVATVSVDRFRAIRSGLVTFREAFTGAVGALTVVTWAQDDLEAGELLPTLRSIDPAELTDDWLPVAGTRLDRKTATVIPYDADDIFRLSRDFDRSMFAFRLSTPPSRITSWPARSSGMFLTALNSEFQALKRSIGGSRSDVAELIPSVYDLRAASFVIVLSVDRQDALFEPVADTRELFERLARFITLAAEEDTTELLDALRDQPRRVRSAFRDMLKPVAETGSGIELLAGIADKGQPVAAAADTQQVERAIRAIENAPPTPTTVKIRRGLLMGSIIRLGRFEIVDLANGRRFVGDMTDEARQQANNLQVGDEAFIEADIAAQVPFYGEDDSEPGTHFTLTRIAQTGTPI